MTTEQLREAVTGTKEIDKVKNDVVITALISAQNKMRVLLPRHLTAERMCRLALGDLRLDAKLRQAAYSNPESLVYSIMIASQLGLEVGKAKGHCYLVPFKNKNTGKPEVTPMPGYRGLIHLARQSGEIASLSCYIAYEHDLFKIELGTQENVTHIPKLEGERGKHKLVYSFARFRDGGHHFDWMSIAEVEKIRKRSKQPDSGPWVSDYEEMVRKTMVRRICKMLPSSNERLEQAVRASDAVDKGDPVIIEGTYAEFADLSTMPAGEQDEND